MRYDTEDEPVVINESEEAAKLRTLQCLVGGSVVEIVPNSLLFKEGGEVHTLIDGSKKVDTKSKASHTGEEAWISEARESDHVTEKQGHTTIVPLAWQGGYSPVHVTKRFWRVVKAGGKTWIEESHYPDNRFYQVPQTRQLPSIGCVYVGD